MSDIILNKVSDKEIAKEYKKRFFLKSGDKTKANQRNYDCWIIKLNYLDIENNLKI